MAERHKVVILGSGPAGLTAALYAGRANLEPVLVEGSQPGGQLTITTDVENYPGFPDGVLGPEMMELFRKQAERFGTTIFQGDVVGVELAKRPFVLRIEGREPMETETLIVATGARAKLLGLPSEAELMGFGVSACATCDGFFFKDKPVMVVGGGDTAVEEAIFLTRYSPKVQLVHRRDELRASKIMQDRAFKNPRIEFLWNSAIDEVHGARETGVEAVTLRNLEKDTTERVPTQGVFIAIGHEPNTAIFHGQLEMDDRGYLITQPRTTYTSVPGVFACGDVQDPVYRQAVTAAGTGCMAAIDAERFLEAQGH
jgi:thioredoxin reductase (NADPH)